MEIVWNISQLDCLPNSDGRQDYVVTAHWQCNGVDGDYSGSVYSTTSFAVEEGESFTPYADLTKEQVLGDLPTKSGAWPLVMKIKEQAEPQVPKPEPQEE